MSESFDEEFHQQQQQNEAKAARKVANKKEGMIMAAGYLLGWVFFIVVFKMIYGRYRNSRSIKENRKSWFGKNPEKEAYEKLLQTSPDDEETLRKALMRRAITDMRRYMELNEEKESVYNLMRTGAISEAMWEDFKAAEAELQLEIFDLQAEAETFKKNWSQDILKEAAMLLHKERELQEMKKSKDFEERMRKELEKKTQKAQDHETRMTQEQEEKLAKIKERILAEAEEALRKRNAKQQQQ